MATWSEETKNSASWSEESKNSSSWSEENKEPSGLTFGQMTGTVLSPYKRTDVVQDDGTTLEDTKQSDSVSGQVLNRYIETLWTDDEKD